MKKKINNISGQALTEYLLLSMALILGLSIFSILDDSFISLYNKILEDAFFIIRMPF